jgi:hypothetical protein
MADIAWVEERVYGYIKNRLGRESPRSSWAQSEEMRRSLIKFAFKIILVKGRRT